MKAFGLCKLRQRVAFGPFNIIHFKSPLKRIDIFLFTFQRGTETETVYI